MTIEYSAGRSAADVAGIYQKAAAQLRAAGRPKTAAALEKRSQLASSAALEERAAPRPAPAAPVQRKSAQPDPPRAGGYDLADWLWGHGMWEEARELEADLERSSREAGRTSAREGRSASSTPATSPRKANPVSKKSRKPARVLTDSEENKLRDRYARSLHRAVSRHELPSVPTATWDYTSRGVIPIRTDPAGTGRPALSGDAAVGAPMARGY